MAYTCPCCGGLMVELGCCVILGLPVRWCTTCGTVKPCDLEPISPSWARSGRPKSGQSDAEADEPIIIDLKASQVPQKPNPDEPTVFINPIPLGDQR